MVFAIDLLGRLVDAVSPWLERRGGAYSSGAMRHDCGLCRDSPPSTSALCGDSGAFLHVFGDAGYLLYWLFGHLVITNPHGRPISHAQLPQTAPATPHAPGTHVTSSWPLAELPLAYAGGSLFGAPTAVGRANSVKGYH